MNHDQKELTQKIIEIVKNMTRCDDVNKNSSMENLPEWDSLAYMSILTEVEIIFDIEITEDNINGFNSIESIFFIIQKNNR